MTAPLLRGNKAFKWAIGISTLSLSAGTLWWTRRNKRVSQDSIINSLSTEEKLKALDWIPPKRIELIDRLKRSSEVSNEKPFDLLIIGGGATGTGCAVDAATRGLHVACIERGDFSAETSSKSTKLVHGGIRYLEKAVLNFDWEQFQLVREALRERSIFMQLVPHLAEPLPIMLPLYKWYMIPYYWMGSKAYDLLSGKWRLESSYFLSKTRALEVFPMLRKDSLVGAIVYYDGQCNDARVNLSLALTALQQGAVVTNYVEVVELLKEADHSGMQRICGAKVIDHISGEQFSIKAKGVINATGPFCDHIRKLDDPNVTELVTASSGTHIVFPNYYSPRNMGLVDPASSDGRVIFFLPWQSNTIAGTTDAPTQVHFNPKAKNSEIDFILREVSNYLDPMVTVRRSDILSAWTGIRPLIRDPNIMSTESLVRNHLVLQSPTGLLTIAGGKWTTYRQIAEDTINFAITAFNLNPVHWKSRTHQVPLIGAHGYSPTAYIHLIQQFGLETEVAQHLNKNYGDRAHMVAELSEPTGVRWPARGRRLSSLYPFIEAEVRYAVRNEYAVNITDTLARRTRIAFLSCQAANDALPRVVEIMGEELGWNHEEKEKQKLEGQKFLVSMGIRDLYPVRALFDHLETIRLRHLFNDLDCDKRGRLSLEQILPHLQNLVPDDPTVEPVPWIELVTSHVKKGGSNLSGSASVDFREFLDTLSLGRGYLEQARMVAKANSSTKAAKYSLTKDHRRSGGGL